MSDCVSISNTWAIRPLANTQHVTLRSLLASNDLSSTAASLNGSSLLESLSTASHQQKLKTLKKNADMLSLVLRAQPITTSYVRQQPGAPVTFKNAFGEDTQHTLAHKPNDTVLAHFIQSRLKWLAASTSDKLAQLLHLGLIWKVNQNYN